MPNITATGTFAETTEGFEFLESSREEKVLLFAGTTLPTTLTLQYTDDEGVDHILEDGTIAALPTSIVVNGIKRPLKIVATGGSPNFNVSGASIP